MACGAKEASRFLSIIQKSRMVMVISVRRIALRRLRRLLNVLIRGGASLIAQASP